MRRPILKIKGKFWGPRRAVEFFKGHVETEFLALVSQIKSSDQGDFHCYFTIEVDDK